MRRGALLLVIGLIVLVAVGALFLLNGSGIGQPPAQATKAPTTVPEARVLVAQQDIVRGQPIPPEVIGDKTISGMTQHEATAQGMLEATDANRAYLANKTARQDIKADQPLLKDYVLDTAGYLRGSEASLFIPQGMVAVALPVDRLTSVGYAIQPGDHVDLLTTFMVVSVNPDLQTILPDYTFLTTPDGQITQIFPVGVQGQLPPDNTAVNLIPNPSDKGQRPRAVTQLTLENVLVLRFGEWSTQTGPTPVPTAVVSPTQRTGGTTQQGQQPTVTPVPKPDIVTLALPRQDALVLMYLLHSGAELEFALRAAGDQETNFNLQPVTLAYTFQRFQIEEPTKLPYATEPGLWPLNLVVGAGGSIFPTPPAHPNPTPAPKQ